MFYKRQSEIALSKSNINCIIYCKNKKTQFMYADIKDKTKLIAIINPFWVVGISIASREWLTLNKVTRHTITYSCS